MPSTILPGLITLHGNQLEQLRDTVFDWVQSNPLDPLEQEIFLVQSNGIAEWLKISLAEKLSVYASTRITLPARFLWESYRHVLGKESVARQSAFDRDPLTWRLMTVLPTLASDPIFAPLTRFLQEGGQDRRLQLAEKLADLFDQYQVYRADWLRAWAAGENVLFDAICQPRPLSEDQLWQAHLWRVLVSSVDEAQREGGRADVHHAYLAALREKTGIVTTLPRRVILFGISALPFQTVEALASLAQHAQVIIAVPNPSQYYWGDIISGRELLTAERRRQASRDHRDLASIPFEQMHQHCHPLLASWGRLGRDFVRMLDVFDDVDATRRQFASLRLDVFSEGPGTTMLHQLQAAVRDLQPLAEHDYTVDGKDQSIAFHIAHSTQREVEVLHDQLLTRLAGAAALGNKEETKTPKLTPRDIIVMVPDIDTFAPSIRAVFGQYAPQDKRFIPYDIVDLTQRRINPLLVALDWLLRLPDQRCLQSELRDLLDVPALAARFGFETDDLPRVAQWIEAAGIRWGLDEPHRTALKVGAAGAQNGWLFGLQRMLLGYASGADQSYAGIEPFSQIGGLDAALAGSLAGLVETLIAWRTVLAEAATPQRWGSLARALCRAFFAINDEHDRLTLSKLEQSLSRWLDQCHAGGFDEAVPVLVLREAWLGSFDEAPLNQRFVSGGVTFCTLMPMRAVPYRLVCLLGMNEGAFPRRTARTDFDLLALPGVARPGDRSRRDDDRYLMLEALLSARDALYISWVGRSVRDNSAQPPSVLVSQLRDYLAQGWKTDLSQQTSAHPLQPFSRQYFEVSEIGTRPYTYAREWRAMHTRVVAPLTSYQSVSVDQSAPVALVELERFLKQPVAHFFRQQLKVDFRQHAVTGDDDEPFVLNGLDGYTLDDMLLTDTGAHEAIEDVPARLQQRVEKLAREGRLPIGHLGRRWQQTQVEELTASRAAWITLCAQFPISPQQFPISLSEGPMVVEDWLDHARCKGDDVVWLSRTASKISRTVKEVVSARPEKMVAGFLRQLALSACGYQFTGFLVGRDVLLELPVMDPVEARAEMAKLLILWQQGSMAPLPTAFKTALKLLTDGPSKAQEDYDGNAFSNKEGEVAQPALGRLWSDYAALESEPEFPAISEQLYRPLLRWTNRIRVHGLDALDHIINAQQDTTA